MMNAATSVATLPAMKQLNVSNHLLDDRAALAAAWDRDGYWFFRDVLDQEAVGRLRGVYMDFLAGLGMVERDDPKAIYSGKSLDGFPFRMEPLAQRNVWKPFVTEPAIHAFFQRVLGDDPFWIPTVEYRATPPASDLQSDRMVYVHQDGFYNAGIPFLICWIPLADIDEATGGLILGEAMHKGPYLHDTSQPPMCPIPQGAVPDAAWRRADYRPGDLLLMDLGTPHTGLSNHSDRFRLSMDIRVMGASGATPIVGKLAAISSSAVSVVGEDGRRGDFIVDQDTYCRGLDGVKVGLEEIAVRFKVGDSVIVASKEGRATVIRPPH
ncbi:MAG: phytanoyl-CoA dioxygenase family protein [Pseudomonadota bacterium]